MQTFDFSPLFRSTIGFDRMLDWLDQAVDVEAKTGYPPYNIERTGDESYRLTVVVAGFRPEELSVISEGVTLTVSGEKKVQTGSDQYLHRGIAGRSFKRTFQLAEYIKVEGARLENGLLWIDLKWDVPEAMKPRIVPIGTAEMPTKAVPFSAVA
jgi:molecular chaperone IbpA